MVWKRYNFKILNLSASTSTSEAGKLKTLKMIQYNHGTIKSQTKKSKK